MDIINTSASTDLLNSSNLKNSELFEENNNIETSKDRIEQETVKSSFGFEEDKSVTAEKTERKPCSYYVTRGIALSCLILLVVFIAIYWQWVEEQISNVIIWMSSHPAGGPFIVAGIFAVATSLVFVPSTVPIICVGSGCAFTKAYGSAWWGMLIALIACYVGAAFGSLFAFVLGRYIFKE
jgi:hypothetical protein